MSGFVGVWNRDGEPVTTRLLDDLWFPIQHRGPDGVDRWISGSVGLIAGLHRVTPESLDEVQPILTDSGAAVVFNGRLDDRSQLVSRLGKPGDASDPALIGAAFEALGDGFAEALAGEYAVAVADPGRHQLLLACDAMGMKPLYMSQVGSTVIFGTEVKALLAHPRQPTRVNDDLLSYYLLQGTARDNLWDTFFEGIRVVGPGHVVRVTQDRIHQRRFWEFDVASKLRMPSYEDYVDAFRQLFAQAVRRRLRSAFPVGFSVSGGIDSSSVFCQALALRNESGMPELVAVTQVGSPGGPADELDYVHTIETKWGIEVATVPLESPSGQLGADVQTRVSEMPWINELWAPAIAVTDIFKERGVRRHLTGHWGDQLLYDPTYLVDLFNQLHWVRVAGHLREMPRWEAGYPMQIRRFLEQLVRWDVPRSIVPLLRWLDRTVVGPRGDADGYGARIRSHGVATPPGSVTVGFDRSSVHARNLYAKTQSKYYLMAHEWDEKVSGWLGEETSSPLFDRDLVAFVMAVPGEVTNMGGRQRSLLRDAMRGVLPDDIRTRRTKADFTALANVALADELRLIASGRLRASPAARLGYIRPAAVEARAGAITSDPGRFMDFASHLSGLEAWFDVFFGDAQLPAERWL